MKASYDAPAVEARFEVHAALGDLISGAVRQPVWRKPEPPDTQED